MSHTFSSTQSHLIHHLPDGWAAATGRIVANGASILPNADAFECNFAFRSTIGSSVGGMHTFIQSSDLHYRANVPQRFRYRDTSAVFGLSRLLINQAAVIFVDRDYIANQVNAV